MLFTIQNYYHLIVTINDRSWWLNLRSDNNDCTYISVATTARLPRLVSTFELATGVCILDQHEINLKQGRYMPLRWSVGHHNKHAVLRKYKLSGKEADPSQESLQISTFSLDLVNIRSCDDNITEVLFHYYLKNICWCLYKRV